MPPIIRYNALESEAHQVKIGSCDADCITQTTNLYRACIDEAYDVVKMHLPCENINLFVALQQLAMPYHIHYASFVAEIDLSKYNPANFPATTDFDFQYRLNHNPNIAREVIRDSIGDMKNYYFNHPINDFCFKKDKIFDLHADYVASFSNPNDTTKEIYIGWLNEQTVGFFALDLKNDREVLAYMGGVLPAFRHHKVAYVGYKRIIEDYLLPRGIKKMLIEIQIQNNANLRAAFMRGIGLVPVQAYFRVLLYPLAGIAPQKGILLDANSLKPSNYNHIKLFGGCQHAQQGEIRQVIDSPNNYQLVMQSYSDAQNALIGYQYYEQY